MTETDVSNRIRDAVKEEYGTVLHKYHGGSYGESGASDLYGTLPGGYAVYFEVKTPRTIALMDIRRKLQDIWLRREENLGACTGVVASKEEALILIREYLSTRGGKTPS